ALTAKQQRFIEEYCSNGFNATKAAISAGYSEKTAKDIACQNLAKVYIQDEIEAFMSKATERALVTTEDVVRGLLAEAQYTDEGASPSARVSAWKALTDYTGGFDNNRKKVDANVMINKADDSEW
ncbi:terminase small subunit, partial [Vibrio phage 1.085.O._10N.222.51.E3]